MKRREFLFTSAAGLTCSALFPTLLNGCEKGKDPLHDIGLITNVVADLMKADHRGTMKKLAEMGYRYLEFGGTYGEKPAELKAFMKEIGLIPLAGGTSISGLLGDGLQKVMDDCLDMDKSTWYAIGPGWMTVRVPPSTRLSLPWMSVTGWESCAIKMVCGLHITITTRSFRRRRESFFTIIYSSILNPKW